MTFDHPSMAFAVIFLCGMAVGFIAGVMAASSVRAATAPDAHDGDVGP